LRKVVTFPGLFLEEIMRGEVSLRTCRNINFEQKMRPRGAGTCLSDINDGTVHRCADSQPLFFPVHNPGGE